MKESLQVFSKGKKIYVVEWPVANPKAIIILVHGLGEHIRRYDAQFQYFNQNGFTCIGSDLPGHGRTEGSRGLWSRINELNDVLTGTFDYVTEQYKDIPVILYGHSMGGNIAAGYCLSRIMHIKGLILTGAALKTPKDMPLPVIKALLQFPLFIRNIRIPNGLNLSSLCNDQNIVKTYLADPLVHNKISLGAGATILSNAANILRSTTKLPYPVLIMHGSLDKICYPEGSKQLHQKISDHSTLQIWPGMLHEIHNEPNKKEVWDYTIHWMNKLFIQQSNKVQ